jgi:hypothetical protein
MVEAAEVVLQTRAPSNDGWNMMSHHVRFLFIKAPDHLAELGNTAHKRHQYDVLWAPPLQPHIDLIDASDTS